METYHVLSTPTLLLTAARRHASAHRQRESPCPRGLPVHHRPSVAGLRGGRGRAQRRRLGAAAHGRRQGACARCTGSAWGWGRRHSDDTGTSRRTSAAARACTGIHIPAPAPPHSSRRLGRPREHSPWQEATAMWPSCCSSSPSHLRQMRSSDLASRFKLLVVVMARAGQPDGDIRLSPALYSESWTALQVAPSDVLTWPQPLAQLGRHQAPA